VVWKTPPALARFAVLLALTLVLASCGGGSTAGPVATSDARRASAPPARTQPPAGVSTPAPQAAVPRTTEASPAPAAGGPRASTPHSRRPGGAAAPTGADSPAAVADESETPPERTSTPPPDRRPAAFGLDERARLTLVRRVSPSHYFQQGTVTGTYAGTMEVEARITSKGVLVRFTATLPGGTISGRGIAVAILDSTTWPSLRGTAKVTGGTGRFAGIHGRRLRVTGRAKPDASRARVRLAGTVTLG
jgi:hypothetical protein